MNLDSLQLSYHGGGGGSEEFAVLVVSGLGWITGPFLRAGAGARRFRTGSGPGGLGGAGSRSGRDGEAPVGLGARVGAGGGERMPQYINHHSTPSYIQTTHSYQRLN